MTTKRRWSGKDDDDILKLWSQGCQIPIIAAVMSRTEAACIQRIRILRLKGGIEHYETRRIDNRLFTKRQDQYIRVHHRQGTPSAEIAADLGVREDDVKARLKQIEL